MTQPAKQSRLRLPLPFARIVYALIFMAFLGSALCLWLYMAPGPLEENKTVVVSHGASVREIASLLAENGVIKHPLIMRLAAKISPHGHLKAGEYEFTPHQSTADVLLMMQEGHSVVHMFTAAEGLTSADIANALNNNPLLTGDITPPAEGTLLPETYRYSYGDTRTSILARMDKDMKEVLANLWVNRDQSIPIATPDQAVTMASIIEKETGKPEERARIAGVFYNRLRAKMKLQSDPTVIYAIVRERGPLNRELAHDDLAFASPYNTYMNEGLPPGPICNPGRAALDAALHPEQHDYFYFVADGTGGHVFAHDLPAHNQNVTKWLNSKESPPAKK